MGNIFARREELLKEAEEVYREIFRESILCLEESYHTEGYKKSVTEAFAKTARMWKENYENKAASLGICSLYTSILRRTYAYRIVLLGEEFWLARDAVELMWVPEGFPEFFERDIFSLMKKLKGTFPRLCRDEETAVRFMCGEYCHGAVYKLCADFLEDILKEEEFLQLSKTEDFFVFFGDYRGEGEILYRVNER